MSTGYSILEYGLYPKLPSGNIGVFIFIYSAMLFAAQFPSKVTFYVINLRTTWA